jgi:hypothetical protein
MDPKYKTILLSNDSGERLELQDAPQGWDAEKFRLIRDLTYIGILKSISVEFDFVGDAYRFMQRQRMLYGIDADVTIRQYRRNPNEFLFEGKVNQENYIEDRKFHRYKIDIVQSSFVQKFQNREDVQLNVLNTYSLDRLPVAAASFKNGIIRGRSIFFFSEFFGSSQEAPQTFSHTLPFLNKESGNPGVNKNPYEISVPEEGTFEEEEQRLIDTLYGTASSSIYRNNLITAQTIDIAFEVNFNIVYKGLPLPIFIQSVGDISQYADYKLYFRVVLVTPIPGGGITTEVLKESTFETAGNFSFNYAENLEFLPGQYLVIACEFHLLTLFYEDGDLDEIIEINYMPIDFFGVDLSNNLKTEVLYNSMHLTIKSDSSVPQSTHPVLLPFELFQALIAQMTDGEFVSDYFGRTDLGYAEDGQGAYLAITTGQLLRGIPLEEVQVATSMRDAFSSYSTICFLGAIINDKTIRIEPLDRLFNGNIAVALGEVSELTISPTKEFLFNSVKAGYPINEYEEQNGRDEFNTTYQYTNSLKAVKKELDLVSKYCGDGYGIEFARRESIVDTGSKDSKYDSKIFFIDMIKVGEDIISRRQEGILHVEGIFSPETAINLRIAVGQNMLRGKPFLNIPLAKKNQVYYFQSKDKNAGLVLVTALGTTIDGQDLNTSGNALFLPEDRKFKCPFTVEQLFAILANPLGIVSYTYDGEKFFDFIFEVDAETEKGRAEWRTLGTKDTPVERIPAEEVVTGNIVKYGDGLTDYVKYGSGEDDYLLYQ